MRFHGHIANINQQEPLKVMQHVSIMVAMKTIFASHYRTISSKFFPSVVIFSQTGILFLLVDSYLFLSNNFLQFLFLACSATYSFLTAALQISFCVVVDLPTK